MHLTAHVFHSVSAPSEWPSPLLIFGLINLQESLRAEKQTLSLQVQEFLLKNKTSGGACRQTQLRQSPSKKKSHGSGVSVSLVQSVSMTVSWSCLCLCLRPCLCPCLREAVFCVAASWWSCLLRNSFLVCYWVVYTHIYVFNHICRYICTYLYVSIWTNICTYWYMCTYTTVDVHVNIYICMYT